MKILLGFIGIVIALWFLWFFTGGPERFEANPQPKFIDPTKDFIIEPIPVYNGL